MEPSVRIAMWSGPRNISTAMMRAFENRPDCTVVDEPFYAAYLSQSGIDHPMGEEIIASQPTNPHEVIARLVGPEQEGRAVHYQKLLTHHMLPPFELDWLEHVTSCFLIRSPDEIIASYIKKRGTVSQQDLGIKRQYEIFNQVRERTGKTPPVLDAANILKDPEGQLTALCKCVGIDFSNHMLAWPKGRRASDGVWASHWYESVEASTGFAPYKERGISLPPALKDLADECQFYYSHLNQFAI